MVWLSTSPKQGQTPHVPSGAVNGCGADVECLNARVHCSRLTTTRVHVKDSLSIARFSDHRMSWKKIDQRGSLSGDRWFLLRCGIYSELDALTSSWATVRRESEACVGLGEAFGQPLAPR